MFLLDTNFLSAMRRPDKADPNVLKFSRHHSGTNSFISAISIMEIELGAHLLARRDKRQSGMLFEWLENHLLPEYAGRILDVSLKIARRSSALHVPDPQPFRDAFIAATALVHDLTIVTRNVRDFSPTGVPVINPWEYSAQP
jgi:toxin FitB